MINTRSGYLYMFFGRKRCGKSTLLTRLAVTALAHGQRVYSTIPIAGTYLFDGKQTGFFHFEEGSLVLIDEVGLVFPSRDFKSFKSETRALFKLQGHYKLTIVICSQSFDVDKCIRDLCDEIYLVKKWFKVLSVCKRVRRSIVVTKATDYGGSTFADQYEITKLPIGRNRIFTFMPLYWKKFDSYAAPALPDERSYVKLINENRDVGADRGKSSAVIVINNVKRGFAKLTFRKKSLEIDDSRGDIDKSEIK